MLSIGVTGHRDLPAELQLVGDALVQIFERIRTDFPAGSYAIISPLAEGADRLVAQIGIEMLFASLVVPLPMPILEYLRDFESKILPIGV